MSRKVVGKFVFSASRVRENVIGCKLALCDLAATKMAARIRFVEHVGPLLGG